MFAILAALAYFIAFFNRSPLGFDLVIAGHLCVALHLAIAVPISVSIPSFRRRPASE